MTNRQIVIDLVSKLPKDMPLIEISRKIKMLAGIQIAREQAHRGEGVSALTARKLVDGWAAK